MAGVVLCCRICRMTLSDLTSMSGLTELAGFACQVIQVKSAVHFTKICKNGFQVE